MTLPLYLCAIALVISIFLSAKFKLPLGVLAMLSAFLVGNLAMGLRINDIVAQWPTSTIYSLIMATAFYGFFAENGTMEAIGKRMIRLIHGRMTLFPLMAGILFAILSFAIGAQATFTIGPVLYAMGIAGGIEPAMIALIFGFAGMIGSVNPWTGYGGIIMAGQVEANGFANHANISMVIYITFCAVCILVLLVAYFLFKCHKAPKMNVADEKLEDMTQVQKTSFIVFVVSIILICVPALAGLVSHSPFVKTLSGILCTQVIFSAGVLVCIVLKLGSFQGALRRVPVGILLMISGMTMLLFVAKSADLTTVLGNAIGDNVPYLIVPGALVLLSALLSFFSSAVSAVVPLFFPIAIQIATVTGHNPVALMACVLAGAMSSACSPLSGMGASNISVAPADVQDGLGNKMMIAAVTLPVFIAILATLGFFNLIPALFGGVSIAY